MAGEEEYEVERLVRYRKKGDSFLVKWSKYPSSENSWEPADDLPEDAVAAWPGRILDPPFLASDNKK
jgi:hypothetical protein